MQPNATPEPMKHLGLLVNGSILHLHVLAKNVGEIVKNLAAVKERAYGMYYITDGTGKLIQVDVQKIDGWFVDDIQPNMAQVIVAAINQDQKPPDDPADHWKKG